jgi:hypothetical protein
LGTNVALSREKTMTISDAQWDVCTTFLGGLRVNWFPALSRFAGFGHLVFEQGWHCDARRWRFLHLPIDLTAVARDGPALLAAQGARDERPGVPVADAPDEFRKLSPFQDAF